jgi:ATP-binding cassette, subfamily B, bacterial PglK
MMTNLKKGLALIRQEHRRQLAGLFILMLVVAMLETMGIGLLMPYIALVNSPEAIMQNQYAQALYNGFGFTSPRALISVASVALILLFVFKNIVYTCQQYIQFRRLLEIQLDIEGRLMSSYLEREYLFFTQKNPSELYQNIRNVSGIVALIYSPLLTIATESSVLLLIGAFLLLVQPIITLATITVSAVMVYLIYRITRRRASQYGIEGNRHMVEMNKWMYQSFGGIKEVKLLSKEDFFVERSILYSRKAAWFSMKAAMLSTITRPLIETTWFSLTVLLVLISIQLGKEGATMLPILTLLAAAAIRIMPALNRILNATILIRQATDHVGNVYRELGSASHDDQDSKQSSLQALHFVHGIDFENIGFTYPGSSKPVLQQLSFNIKKGQSIAFVGPSGSGKTTAVDILLGLLDAQSGSILIDGMPLGSLDARAWRRNFGYVPQSIYLSDDTIRNNIAFGQAREAIDDAQVEAVIKQAQLAEVIKQLPHGLDTLVGDRGVRLSGGQRQRIGIARALYHNPPILVLDEATSALDNETEREITLAIQSLSGSKTVILIAHRLSTVAHCDSIIFLSKGIIQAKGSYEDLLNSNIDFRRFATAGVSDGQPLLPL